LKERWWNVVSEKRIAIITARGGSKRIPHKNRKDFCGKPILAYSIQAAIESGLFDEVMVSTDSEEIADIARQYGAKVPFMRSEKTSDDYATTADVLCEVLDEYHKRGRDFEYMACLYPTAPFVTPEKLQKAVNLLEDTKDAKAVMPVVPFSYPPQRGYVFNGPWVEMKWKEHYASRSQDLEKMYHDCGQFYVYKVKDFLEAKGVFAAGVVPMIMDELEVQDIDNETDWRLAELKYRMMCDGAGN
jgi:N-acylneuraminate cytidylyltransferase